MAKLPHGYRLILPHARGAAMAASQAEPVSFRQAVIRLRRAERLERAGFVEPYEGVELLREHGFAVVAPSLGLRAVDHPDEPFEPRFGQPPPQRLVLAFRE